MSYRAIIADDEKKIIELIVELGNWAEEDIEIVDTCTSGRAAYESILKNRPDFVLSDIKMPGMDGLELIQKVREQSLDPLFILISGYRHFEYARTAISLNVMDYLLKPVDEQQLNETLHRVCRRIDQIRSQVLDAEEARQRRSDQAREKMDRFFGDILFDELRLESIVSEEQCNRTYHTDFSSGIYQALFVFTNLSAVIGGNLSVSSDRLEKCMSESFPEGIRYCSSSNFMGTVIILNYDETMKKKARQSIDALYYSIRSLREVFGDFMLHIGVGNIHTSINELKEAVKEAHAAEWGRLVLTRDGVLEYMQVSNLPSFKMEEVITQENTKQITDCLKYMRKDELGSVFEEIYSRASKFSNKNPGCMMDTFFGLNIALDAVPAEDERERFHEKYYYVYMNNNTFPKVIKGIYLMLSDYIDERLKEAGEKKGRPAEQAIRYIRERYPYPISLEDVAEAVNISPKYLSRLFKDEIKIGFSEYVTQVRIEESQKLLSDSNMSIKDIAAAVGYLDEKYYSKIFKKATGLKPTEYRRIYG